MPLLLQTSGDSFVGPQRNQNITGAYLIACITSHEQARDRVGTIIIGRAKATVLKKYSGTDLLPKPPVVLIENFREAGDVITEPERTRQHHLLHKHSRPQLGTS